MRSARAQAAAEFRRAERLIDRAVVGLSHASRILADQGHTQSARSLNNAGFEAATAISQAAADHRRKAP